MTAVTMPVADTDDPAASRAVSRAAASAAVTSLGWRYLRSAVRTSIRAGSPARAADVATRVFAAAGDLAGQHLRADIRGEQLVLTVQSLATTSVTDRDIDLARRISALVSELGLATSPEGGPGEQRTVQILEIAIDALDIASIRPFWQAVLGYAGEPGTAGPAQPLADPVGQGPTIWFQQMDAPRPQRNRIHLDITVPHDEAPRRVADALAAGGQLVSNAEAPACWVLADAEGNEACICTWQGRGS